MLKAMTIGLTLATLAAPAMAMDMKCDEASMSMMKSDIDGTKDASMKKMASDHMMMAQQSMKAGKMDDCKMHMGEAMKSMGKM
jgi:hypothetical protein